MYIYAHIYIHKMNGNTYNITVGRLTALISSTSKSITVNTLKDECSLFKNLEIPAGHHLQRCVAPQ